MTTLPPAENSGDDFESFWHEHQQRLRSFIARRVSDRNAVQDLEQQVWEALMSYGDLHGRPDDPVKLMYAIARNKTVDWFRHQGKVEQYPDDQTLAELVSRHPEHTSAFSETSDAAMDVAKAMARLTPSQRQALQLQMFDGLDRATIAAEMGISVNVVKKHLTAARTNLRRSLELAGYDVPAAFKEMRR